MTDRLQIVALEEHYLAAPVAAAWRAVPEPWRDPATGQAGGGAVVDRLMELGDARIADMDAAGIDVQVLSHTAPGLAPVDAADAAALARDDNDRLAAAIARHPTRLQGFATLPAGDGDAAARELARGITELGFVGGMSFGRARDRNLEDAANWPLFEAAAHHRAPLYLHPQVSVPAVRQALYGGFGDPVDGAFAAFGLGWHYEAGVQLIRLILAGVFDRFPDLTIVTGHWGEVVLFYLERIAGMNRFAKTGRPIADYFGSNIHITPSGIWSERFLRWAIEMVGVEAILFSTDYPYRFEPDGAARRFLEDADLSAADRTAIAHGNWDRMTAAIRR